MSRLRVPGLFAAVLLMAACRPGVAAGNGFIAAWREFLELDGPGPLASPGSVARSARQTGVAAADTLTEQLRGVYVDSNTYLAGFPEVEQRYDSVIHDLGVKYDRLKAAPAGVDASDAAAVLVAALATAADSIERQHRRTAAVAVTFDQRMQTMLKTVAQTEKACASVAAGTDAAQSCARFLDGLALTKAKADLVRQGFASVDAAYASAVQARNEIAAKVQALPAAASKK